MIRRKQRRTRKVSRRKQRRTRKVSRRKQRRTRKVSRRKSYKHRGGALAPIDQLSEQQRRAALGIPDSILLDNKIYRASLDTILGYLEDTVEYCGFFYVQYGNYHIMRDQITKGIHDGDRSQCTHKDFYREYIWHTHRNGGKYYPSLEDIEKVIKHKSIEQSFIFVTSNAESGKQIGMWVLHCNFDIRVQPAVVDPEISLINEENKKFYENTKGGTYFDVGAIQSYKDALNSGIDGLRIDYYIYDSSTGTFVNCTESS